MEAKRVNEDSAYEYPEIFDGATDWASREGADDEPITVSSNGLRRILRLIEDCRRVAMGAYLKLHASASGRVVALYEKDLSPDNLVKVMNDTSGVWCEGDLIVSGLFIDPADGKVMVNKCDGDEEDEQLPAGKA